MPLTVPVHRIRLLTEAHKAVVFVGAVIVALAVTYLSVKAGTADIVKKAACDANNSGPNAVNCNNAGGLKGFVDAADALISPAVVALIAIAPLGAIIGAAALMFGNRRGLVIVGSSLGALVFVASLKGIVA